MSNIIYVAVHKEKQTVLSGRKGQAAFFDTKSLKLSIGQSFGGFGSEARIKGVDPKDLYSIHEIDVSQVLPIKQTGGIL